MSSTQDLFAGRPCSSTRCPCSPTLCSTCLSGTLTVLISFQLLLCSLSKKNHTLQATSHSHSSLSSFSLPPSLSLWLHCYYLELKPADHSPLKHSPLNNAYYFTPADVLYPFCCHVCFNFIEPRTRSSVSFHPLRYTPSFTECGRFAVGIW